MSYFFSSQAYGRGSVVSGGNYPGGIQYIGGSPGTPDLGSQSVWASSGKYLN